MNNERLKILTDTLTRLTEIWINSGKIEDKSAVYEQMNLIRKLIREECGK